ncbi:MAG: 50S ribosomal protein L1 [Enterobacterales bacterium]
MSKLTKKMINIRKKFNSLKEYKIDEAFSILKKYSSSKFVESVDVAINLSIDARKSDQNIKGVITFPNIVKKNTIIAVFTKGKNIEVSKNAGADFVGSNDLANEIKNGQIKFNVVLATPDTIDIVNTLGKILGPRGLMPSYKYGTINQNIEEAIKNVKNGQKQYKNDKNGIIHISIGNVNFSKTQIKENLKFLLNLINQLKPIKIKGTYIKSIYLSTTMGIGLAIDQESIM